MYTSTDAQLVYVPQHKVCVVMAVIYSQGLNVSQSVVFIGQKMGDFDNLHTAKQYDIFSMLHTSVVIKRQLIMW